MDIGELLSYKVSNLVSIQKNVIFSTDKNTKNCIDQFRYFCYFYTTDLNISP